MHTGMGFCQNVVVCRRKFRQKTNVCLMEGVKPQKHRVFPPGFCNAAFEEVSEPLMQRGASLLSFAFSSCYLYLCALGPTEG